MQRLITIIISVALLLGSAGVVQAAEKYLFYVHGCCIDRVGTDDYEKIISDLRADGFNVVFELRYDDSIDSVRQYAATIADKVKGLLAKGTAPEDITVSGFSIGSTTTLYAAINIANPKINYVLLAGCPGPRARHSDVDYAKVQGRVLSIVDTEDRKFGSCKGHLPESVLRKEEVITSGKGHKIFRLTSEKAYKLWKEPLEAWARGQ